ncbi:flavodoxin family protein [Clostridium akagii]|uniref:flavodoxin family protein n=1 Tax=Clostridium akagii TaxID=91623 RepID=UPI00047B3466|nr:hypothetical protein [Clostridium akagii]
MNYKVVYFSKTGNSKRVAEKIGDKLSCEVTEITDNQDWKGVLGFLKGGYYAMTKKNVEIKINKKSTDADEIIVVSPLWASGVAPAIKSFLETTKLDKVHLVVTSTGSKVKEREGFKSVSDVVKKNNDEDAVIDNLIKSLV